MVLMTVTKEVNDSAEKKIHCAKDKGFEQCPCVVGRLEGFKTAGSTHFCVKSFSRTDIRFGKGGRNYSIS